jgi:hypothetical protein
MPRSKLFFDTEFTGLRQGTGLISLALCAADGRELYAELSDFEREACDPWVARHVLPHTRWLHRQPLPAPRLEREGGTSLCLGGRERVRQTLQEWLAGFGPVELWGDCPAYDWVLFCELFGGALALPSSVYYIPFDLATLLRVRGLDPDSDRAELAGGLEAAAGAGAARHNALTDARLIRACHARLDGP